MRVGMMLNYSGGFSETVAELADFEQAGLQIVFVPEAYSFDAVSQLGFIAARTTTLEIALRHPADLLTDPGADRDDRGRPGLRLRRPVHPRPRHLRPAGDRGLARRPLRRPDRPDQGADRDLPDGLAPRPPRLPGQALHAPAAGGQGTGLGKPLKLINHPVRDRIPIVIAALGPKNVELAAELAEGWQPIFYFPEKAAVAWAEPLAKGRAKRAADLPPLDVIAAAPLAIGDDVTHLREVARPVFALYIGGMGARGRNFYHDLACRYGYEQEADAIQDAYLAGRKDEAAALVPAELVEKTALIGPKGYVAERLAAFREAGVTTLNVTPLAPTHEARVADIAQIRELAG